MTAYITQLIWGNHCDGCLQWICAGEWAYYNPYTKKVYHEDCLYKAEVGDE